MEKDEREALADKLEEMIGEYGDTPFESMFDKGVIHGLKVAACIVRDNHPKEDNE